MFPNFYKFWASIPPILSHIPEWKHEQEGQEKEKIGQSVPLRARAQDTHSVLAVGGLASGNPAPNHMHCAGLTYSLKGPVTVLNLKDLN